jgi:hypothetical protein
MIVTLTSLFLVLNSPEKCEIPWHPEPFLSKSAYKSNGYKIQMEKWRSEETLQPVSGVRLELSQRGCTNMEMTLKFIFSTKTSPAEMVGAAKNIVKDFKLNPNDSSWQPGWHWDTIEFRRDRLKHLLTDEFKKVADERKSYAKVCVDYEEPRAPCRTYSEIKFEDTKLIIDFYRAPFEKLK